MNILLGISFGLIINAVTRHECGKPIVGTTILLLINVYYKGSP